MLVVGSAQSGGQIAEELYQHGRDVFLSIGSAGRAPRRYRGKDVIAWLSRIGFFDLTPDKLPVPKEQFAAPHVSGTKGGHTLNLHQFARDGVTLLGHLRGAAGDTISLAPDLHETLARVDQFEREVQKMIDGYVQANGLDAPEEELPQLRDGYEQPIIEELDLKAAGITTVIWATGYTYRLQSGEAACPRCRRLSHPDEGRDQPPGSLFRRHALDAVAEDGLPGRCGRMCRAHRVPHRRRRADRRGATSDAGTSRCRRRNRGRSSLRSIHDGGRRAAGAAVSFPCVSPRAWDLERGHLRNKRLSFYETIDTSTD